MLGTAGCVCGPWCKSCKEAVRGLDLLHEPVSVYNFNCRLVPRYPHPSCQISIVVVVRLKMCEACPRKSALEAFKFFFLLTQNTRSVDTPSVFAFWPGSVDRPAILLVRRNERCCHRLAGEWCISHVTISKPSIDPSTVYLRSTAALCGDCCRASARTSQ